MAMNTASKLDAMPVMGSYYYNYFMARFFAGLFFRFKKPVLSSL